MGLKDHKPTNTTVSDEARMLFTCNSLIGQHCFHPQEGLGPGRSLRASVLQEVPGVTSRLPGALSFLLGLPELEGQEPWRDMRLYFPPTPEPHRGQLTAASGQVHVVMLIPCSPQGFFSLLQSDLSPTIPLKNIPP